ncbi:MAG TPA: hypothetical protein VEF36_00450 [Roseiarcus sp.]|nr:hypothetical protein [Roseiarcus sp.]
MPPAKIRYGILAAPAPSIVLSQFGSIQEVAVIENSARARVGAIPIAGANFRRRPPGGVARIASQAIFVAITAALFIAWLISSR